MPTYSRGAAQEEHKNIIPDIPILANASYANFFVKTLTTSKQILPFSPRRTYLAIQNRGGDSIYIAFDEEATNQGLEIPAGGSFTPQFAPINAIHMIGNIADDSVTVIEGLR